MAQPAPDIGPPASELIPERPTLDRLREASAGCRACELFKTGTQTVFGEGLKKSEIMFVGEQPGDREDRQGKPFVGPAGRVLDQALEEAGIDRSLAYVTNMVKHFRWEAKGKRRIHRKPGVQHIEACRPWLEAEIEQVRPKVVVCLGSTAAKALIGKDFKVTVDRGRFLPSDWADAITGTVHPSSILRAPDDESRHEQMGLFVDDMRAVAARLGG